MTDESCTLGRPAEILIVEDNSDDLLLAQHVFAKTKIPHRLHVARDGQQALSFLHKQGDHQASPRPDLILLDLNMPFIDGREVLKHVKEDRDLRRIPVVILTTSDSQIDRIVTYNAHANAYLVKPLDIDQWEQLIEGLMQFWFRLVMHPAFLG
jgi:two-component system response regulator